MTTVREKDILFACGEWTLRHFGVPWIRRRVGGSELEAPTFTRADAATCATFLDRGGIMREAAAAKLRVTYRDLDGDGIFETPALLCEGACTPAWTHPESLDNAAWTKTNVTIAADAAVAADGTTTMDEIVETATPTVHHFVERATGALTDNRQQLTRFCCAGGDGRDWIRILTLDKSNTARNSWIDLANRVVGTVNSGHKIKVRKLPGGGMEVVVSWNAASGGTSPLVDVVIALADNDTSTYTGDVTKGVYVWGLEHIVDRGLGQSHVANITSSVLTRADEALTFPIGFPPQNLSVLFDHERNVADDLAGVALNVAEARGIFDIGDAGTNHVWAYHDFGSTRQVQFGVRGASTDRGVAIATPAGERLRAAIQVKNFATAPQLAADFGSGLTAFSTATEAFTAWANPRIRVGGITNSNVRLYAALFNLVVVGNGAGDLFSRDELLALVA